MEPVAGPQTHAWAPKGADEQTILKRVQQRADDPNGGRRIPKHSEGVYSDDACYPAMVGGMLRLTMLFGIGL